MAGVSPEKLIERLASGKPVPAVVLLGTDHYLREMCRNKIVETCVPESARDWAVTRISARDAGWDEILGRAQTLPMLAPRQVLIVEEAESVEKLGEKARDAVLETLGAYFDSPAPFTVLLLEASSLDGRQRFFKLLSEKALIAELVSGEIVRPWMASPGAGATIRTVLPLAIWRTHTLCSPSSVCTYATYLPSGDSVASSALPVLVSAVIVSWGDAAGAGGEAAPRRNMKSAAPSATTAMTPAPIARVRQTRPSPPLTVDPVRTDSAVNSPESSDAFSSSRSFRRSFAV